MDLEEIKNHDWNSGEESVEVSRSDVIIRLIYTLVFTLIIGVIDTLLVIIVAFQLLFSLITQTLPTARVQGFANSVIAFYYQVLRYITHNDSVIPFPFSDLPDPVEPTRPAYAAARRNDPEEPAYKESA